MTWVQQQRNTMKPQYISYSHASMDWVYHYMEYFESSNKKSPTCIHGRLKSYVQVRRKLAQSEIQALIETEKKDEEFLDMGNMD